MCGFQSFIFISCLMSTMVVFYLFFECLVYFSIVAADGLFYWVVVAFVCSISLVSSYGFTLGGGYVWYFNLGSLELFLEGLVVHPCLGVELWHQFFSNSLIAFIFDSPTWKGGSGCGTFKNFTRSSASLMALSLELKLVIFINSGKKSIVFGVVSLPVSILLKL